MKTVRAFVAITLPEDVRQHLAEVSQTLAAQLPPQVVRWVQPRLIHLTLRFLGDVQVEKMPALTHILDTLTTMATPFTMTLGKLGCFPNPQRPRVIWVGLQDKGQAAALQQSLDHALIPLGWMPESKPFQAHLTLGRVKGEATPVRQLPWDRSFQSLPVPVTALHLIESQLRPGGPVYTIRHTSPLGN